MLIVLTCTLSTALTASRAAPTTRPATQQRKNGDPAGKLRTALPKGWSLWGSALVGRTVMHPGAQWSRVPAGYVKLRSPFARTRAGFQRATPPIIVYLAHRQAEKAKPQTADNLQDIERKKTEYLGRGTQYHVYVHLPPQAAERWPTAKEDIAKALGIKTKTATTHPAESTEKLAVIRIAQKGDAVWYTVDGARCEDIEALRGALSKLPKDFRLNIQIETNAPAGQVAKVMAAARKLHLMRISITVVRTSRPPAKPKWKPPL